VKRATQERQYASRARMACQGSGGILAGRHHRRGAGLAILLAAALAVAMRLVWDGVADFKAQNVWRGALARGPVIGKDGPICSK
jgi:hypothetical protein